MFYVLESSMSYLENTKKIMLIYDFINEDMKFYFATKIVLTYCEKNCYSDRENFLTIEAEAKFLRSLEQFFVTLCFF